jgi:hypothetical protein
MQLTDEEKHLLIEALDVTILDASHSCEYGGEPEKIPQYTALKDALENTLEDTL